MPLRNTRKNISANIKYHHVDGHMDKYLPWNQLTLEQKMNIRCNKPTKRAVHKAIVTGMRRNRKQLLHSEDAAVFVDNRRLTRELEKAVRYTVGKEHACDYLINQEDWTVKKIDEVDWNRLHGVLGNNPEGYKTWLDKQHTGFYGTRAD